MSPNKDWRVVFVTKASNPQTAQHIESILARSVITSQESEPPKFNLRFISPVDRIVRIALILTAYLLAFERFGYGLIVNPAWDYLRSLFKNPKDEDAYPHGVLFNAKFSDEFLGINIITAPSEMQSYLVVFDLVVKQRKIDRIGVILPGWANDPTSLYTYFDSVNGQLINFSARSFPSNVDFLLNSPLAALDLWNRLCSDSIL